MRSALCLLAFASSLSFGQDGLTRLVSSAIAPPMSFDAAAQVPSTPRLYVGRANLPQARLTRLEFGDDWEIAEGTMLELVSCDDGQTQWLNSESLRAWHGFSAVFNGEAVDVFAWPSKGDRSTKFSIRTAHVMVTGGYSFRAMCGSDDRVASNSGPVARFSMVCTSFLLPSGHFVTANLCDFVNGDFVEFNVPPSWADGTPRAASPDDQYPVNVGSAVRSTDASDWAIFTAGVNSNTGRSALGSQRQALRLRARSILSNVPIVALGYGIDSSPPGTRNDRNAQSQTLQSSPSTLTSASGNIVNHFADTTPGSNGSPLVDSSGIVALGMHTGGGCVTGTGNLGINLWSGSFATSLLAAIGSNSVFLDSTYTSGTQSGTIYEPFRTSSSAAAGVPTGGRILALPGTYSGPVRFDRACRIEAPLGTVEIGR